jgi:uncharacterized membrane protein
MDAPSNRDLSAACVWATATIAAAAVGDHVLLRAILGLPMVLFVPGHAMLRAVGVKTDSVPEHLAYAVGASFAFGIAGGLVLNALGFLTPLGWAIWFWAITLGASLIAARGHETPVLAPGPWPMAVGIRGRHVAIFALAMLVTTGAFALAVRDESRARQFQYTEFWMVPSATGDRLAVGIRNVETETTSFDVEVTLDGHRFAVFQGLAMAPGATWSREIPMPVSAAAQKAEAKLYRPDNNRLYRSVSALVPGT